jgi:hypothetical protein
MYNSAVTLLSSTQLNNNNPDAGLTVFVPIYDSFNALDNAYLNDLRIIRDDMYNLILRKKYNLAKLCSLSVLNLTLTFSVRPRLFVKVVRNL